MALLMACGTQKNAVKQVSSTDFSAPQFLQLIATPSASMPQAIVSKLKFSAKIGAQDISVGGQLRMKRDQVIRIQLMALGLVEAGRLEFTPDYVLLMDRINKQYVKANYENVDFLRQSGISFYTLQSLFWNELFEPGERQPRLDDFVAVLNGDTVTISLPEPVDRLSYLWLAEAGKARITTACVDHRDAKLRWNYQDFRELEKHLFPTDMKVSVDTKKKQVAVGLQLSNLSSDDDWEPLTTVSSKYKEVSVDDILRRLMSL